MKRRTSTTHIVIHCADTYADMDIDADEIRKWHVDERGWSDIGYHKVIKRDGTVENGRDIDVSGAHAAGFNSVSVGVCLVGGRGKDNKAENNFTEAQMASLREVVEELMAKYEWAQPMGHRDLPNVTKECPSFDVLAWWHGEENNSTNHTETEN